MQATEKIDDSVKSLVHLKVRYAFEPLPELPICVLSDVDWRELLLVHELLEWVVTSFLEHHLICEAVIDQLIDFSLELEKFLSEKMWVLDIILVHNDFLAPIKDIRVHLLNDETKRVLVTFENVVK